MAGYRWAEGWRHRIRAVTSNLAFLPSVFAAVAVFAAVLLLWLEPRSGPVAELFPGDEDSARAILATIAGSTITLAGLVFSITMLVLQLSSSQYSPSVLRSFLSDRWSQFTLATFVATFTFTVVVLRAVGGTGPARPTLSVTVSQLLMLATIGVLVGYVNHITRRIRVTSILATTMRELGEVARDRAGAGRPPASDWPPRPGGRLVETHDSGFVSFLDLQVLVEQARTAHGRIQVLVRPGEFVRSGQAVMAVWGPGPECDDRLRGLVEVSDERQMDQDPSYGIRRLVDVGLRALSPSTNDPTTAAYAVEHLRAALHDIRAAGLPDPLHCDDEGVPRVLLVPERFGDLVELATRELSLQAGGHPQVEAALQRLAADVAATTAVGAPTGTPSPVAGNGAAG